MRRVYFFVALIAVLLLFPIKQGQAQVIDYGGLEELFGESVTTSATGSPQRVPDVPVTMEIITADDIRRSGATSLPDVFKNTSGVTVWDWTRQNSDVGIRGYNQAYSPRLLVLINGREVYSNTYNYTPWSSLPVQLEEIRQIEIVKGPNTALFGFNAAGGVINIITYHPEFDDVSNVGVTVGSGDYRKVHAVHTVKAGKFNARVSAGGTLADEFSPEPATGRFRDPEVGAINFDGTYKISDDAQIRFEASESHTDHIEYSPIYTPFDTDSRTRSAKVSYDQNTRFGLVQVNAYKNWTHGTVRGLGDVYNTLSVFQVQDIFDVGNDHNFRVQAEARHSDVESATFFGPGGNLGYDVYALSGMWNWKIRDDLSWTNALRFDRLELERSGTALPTVFTSNSSFDTAFTEYSYNSGLVWQATDKDVVRVMTSRGIQSPSLVNFGVYFVVPPLPVTFVGHPNIDPTIVTNYEIGYDRMVEKIGGKIRAALFHQKTKDLKDGTASSFGFPPTFLAGNVGDSSTFGLEFGVKGRIGSKWNWDANYIYQKIDDDVTSIGAAVRGEGNAESILNAHLGYTHGPWEIDGYASYISDYDVQEPGPGASYVAQSISDYMTLRGRIGYQLTDKLTLAISGQELNHSSSERTSGPNVEREVFISLNSDL